MNETLTKQFAVLMFNTAPAQRLSVAINFISKNLVADEVFNKKELLIYLEDHKDELENKYYLPEN